MADAEGQYTCPTCRKPVRLGGRPQRPEWVHEDGSASCTMSPPDKPHERNYPLPRPDDDPSFNFGLIYDVGKVLEAHGFPPMTSRDHVYLSVALMTFMYRRD